MYFGRYLRLLLRSTTGPCASYPANAARDEHADPVRAVTERAGRRIPARRSRWPTPGTSWRGTATAMRARSASSTRSSLPACYGYLVRMARSARSPTTCSSRRSSRSTARAPPTSAAPTRCRGSTRSRTARSSTRCAAPSAPWSGVADEDELPEVAADLTGETEAPRDEPRGDPELAKAALDALAAAARTAARGGRADQARRQERRRGRRDRGHDRRRDEGPRAPRLRSAAQGARRRVPANDRPRR